MVFTLSGIFYIHDTGIDSKKLTLLENTYHSILPPLHYQSDLIIKGDVKLFMVCLTDETVKKLLTPGIRHV